MATGDKIYATDFTSLKTAIKNAFDAHNTVSGESIATHYTKYSDVSDSVSTTGKVKKEHANIINSLYPIFTNTQLNYTTGSLIPSLEQFSTIASSNTCQFSCVGLCTSSCHGTMTGVSSGSLPTFSYNGQTYQKVAADPPLRDGRSAPYDNAGAPSYGIWTQYGKGCATGGAPQGAAQCGECAGCNNVCGGTCHQDCNYSCFNNCGKGNCSNTCFDTCSATCGGSGCSTSCKTGCSSICLGGANVTDSGVWT